MVVTSIYTTKFRYYALPISMVIILDGFDRASNLRIITEPPLKAIPDVAFLIICLRRHWF